MWVDCEYIYFGAIKLFVLAGLKNMTTVCVYYNGVWENRYTYSNFEVTGILIPSDCRYMYLIKTITKRLKLSVTTSDVEIEIMF